MRSALTKEQTLRKFLLFAVALIILPSLAFYWAQWGGGVQAVAHAAGWDPPASSDDALVWSATLAVAAKRPMMSDGARLATIL